MRAFDGFEYVKSFGLNRAEQILAVVPNPRLRPARPVPEAFEFFGYDVVEIGGYSGATNRGFDRDGIIKPKQSAGTDCLGNWKTPAGLPAW